MRLPLVLGRKNGKAASPAISIERLVNGYLEVAPDGKEPTPLLGTPGLVEWAEIDGPIRGFLPTESTLYVVGGSTFYSLAEDGSATTIGTVSSERATVSMATDGTNVVLVDDQIIYVLNGSGEFAAVTDTDVQPATCVVWLDGYFIFTEPTNDEFFISALEDPTSYDSLDFAAAEWKPDRVVAPVLLQRTLFLFGSQTIEAQRNTGGVDFPFSRDDSVTLDIGLIGKDAVTTTSDTAYWMASDKTIRRLEGITPVQISTEAEDNLIATWLAPESTVASQHVWKGHRFIIFRNPMGCIVYDETTQLWHQRKSYGHDTWRCRMFAEAYGMKLFGDASSGKIYSLSDTAYDEAGDVLPFEMVTPYAYQKGQRITFSDVEVVMETGVGSLSFEPKIAMQRTRDGETWSLPRYRGLGKVGQRNKRVLFGPQGQARQMAFKLTITDACKRVILGAYAEGEVEL